MSDQQKLLDLMIDLKEQFNKVSQFLSNGHTESSCEEIICKEYPFEHSFDEVNLRVMDWVDSVAKEVKIKAVSNCSVCGKPIMYGIGEKQKCCMECKTALILNHVE